MPARPRQQQPEFSIGAFFGAFFQNGDEVHNQENPLLGRGGSGGM